MAPASRFASRVTSKEAKKSDDAKSPPAYSAENIQHNMRIIYLSRTFLSIVGGVIAGVLGLTAVKGFLCYFVIMILASAGIAAKTKFDIFSYFDSWQRITFDGITQGFMSSYYSGHLLMTLFIFSSAAEAAWMKLLQHSRWSLHHSMENWNLRKTAQEHEPC